MKIIIACLVIIAYSAQVTAQKKPAPIIDMHIHANYANFAGPPPVTLCIYNEEWPASSTGPAWGDSLIAASKKCKHSVTSALTDDEVMNKSIDIMKRRNVIGVTSGRLTEKWKAAAPDRIISSFYYRADGKDPSPDSVRKLFKDGRYAVFGEIAGQYNGVGPADAKLAPYWALAEEMDIPVGIHIGPGPIGAPYLGWNKYRAGLHSPFLLEEVIMRHPKLRIYIMHAAWPMMDELLAMLWTHPQVYVDISGIITDLSRPAFYSYLKRMVEAGFTKRIMFGSDQMIWPDLIEEAISTIEAADFLTAGQKRDIFYNNAARFLNLSKEEIRKHHGN
jgi:uncharacterized protein